MYKAVIFDLDGVLCYTDKYHYLAWKQIADEEGIYFDEQINTRLKGVSRMDSLDIILERATRRYSADEKFALAEKKNALYVTSLKSIGAECLAEGAVKTLEGLKDTGVKLAVGSSSKNAKFILERTGIMRYLDGVSDGTMITRSKPDPEVFLKAALLLSEKPCDCIVVEDAVVGIEAAVRGGFCSVATGDAKAHEKATYKIDSLAELLDIVKK